MTIGVSGVTSYGLQRADTLGKALLSSTSNLYETAQVGVIVMEKVISETFLIAAGITGIVWMFALMVKTKTLAGGNRNG
jgi:hypothetical protein